MRLRHITFCVRRSAVSRPCLHALVCEKRFLKFETLNPKNSENIVDFQSELATMNCEEGLCSSFQCAVKEILKFPMIVVIRHLKIEVKSSLERFLDAIISNIG